MGNEINRLADSYNAEIWNNFANCFKIVEVKDDILKKVPQDIINVIVELLRYEQAMRWVLEEIPALGNYSVINLVTNEAGIKAVRMFILTMPN